MIAFIFLALTFGGPDIPATDKIVCPGRNSARVSSAAAERLAALEPAWADNRRIKSTATKRSDGIIYPIGGAAWFQGHAGGKDAGENLAYDAGQGVMFSCARYDTAMGFTAWILPTDLVPDFVPRVRLTAPFSTAGGLRMGSTLQQVRALYGNAPVANDRSGLREIQYERRVVPAGNLFYVVDTTFVFHNGKVVGIYRIAGI
jgi:hypothetical protein